MSIPWHNNDLAALARISLSLPSSHTKLSLLFAIMDPIVFVYSFTIEGYNVIVTIEFFFSCCYIGGLFIAGSMDDDFGDVDTLLKL